jgi:hypothetical protein
MGAYLKAELDSPNMFTFDFSVDVVGATATPTIFALVYDGVESVSVP